MQTVSRTLVFFAPLALAGCLAGSGNEPASAGVDPGHAGWVRVTACSGWALCLPSIVAAQDAMEPDMAPAYPLRMDMGVVSDIPDLEVSANCAGNISLTETEIRCAPNGDETASFAFGTVERRGTTEDGWAYTTFVYDDAQVALYRDPASTGAGRHYLEIGTPATAPADPTPTPEPDDGAWEEVVACSGWDLCLPSLVAVADPYEPDTGATYPMRHDIGVVSPVDLEVTEACREHFALDATGNLTCSPAGDASQTFVVAAADRTSTSDDGQTVYHFEYDERARVRLLRNVNDPARYRLEVRLPGAQQ